ncbi:MAG: Asp-tRNA(Asn)/Glu-tRNA(Gln) amidotransferase subunit GatC [Clostridia bacterium]|nr:Asp-tRNA(Asn)/Glu-tRNA(Gln) amidotransferase subunit GatC [Clostridia bacterium]
MKVSREEIKHIANLATLNLDESEIDTYLEHLQDILNFAEVVNNAPVDELDITIGANEAKNIFRKDEIKEFRDLDALLQNAPAKDQNMFKIPKVLQ